MKKLILAAVAFSLLAAPAAQAAERWPFRGEAPRSDRYEPSKPRYDQRYDTQRRYETQRRYAIKAPAKAAPQWKRGQKVPAWQRKNVVRDHRRYQLRAPGRDQQWVRVGNDFLLVSIASGLIAGLIAGR